MADETPLESAAAIKQALLRAEAAQKRLHEVMREAWLKHGHLLVDPGEVQPLAGEPKLPPGGGGGN